MPWIALLALSVSIDLVSSSTRVTSVKSAKPLGISEFQTTGPIDRTPGTPGSDKKLADIELVTVHPLTWIQRKSHRFGQGAHVDGGKSEQDPAELVLTFKTWALYSVRCPCPKSGLLPILGRTLHSTFLQLSPPKQEFWPLRIKT